MIQKTQKRIELHFFEYRKNVLEYDDVLNAQREHIYGMRREYLLGKDPRPTIREYIEGHIEATVQRHAPDGIDRLHWDYGSLYREIMTVFPVVDYGQVEDLEKLKSVEDMADKIKSWAAQAYEERVNQLGEHFPLVEKFVLLNAITRRWTEHLQMIERLREGIGLRGYGQIDPLIAFRKESHMIFEDTLAGVQDVVATSIYRVQVQQQAVPRPQMQRIDERAAVAGNGEAAATAQSGAIDWTKVKRNDPCPCGSGKKFKQCHYREVNA
jgi:preprotein translocase subunit SecA